MKHAHRARRAWGVALAASLALAAVFSPRDARAESVRVIVPDETNLQYMAFWVARGAGYFEDEGLTVEVVVPERPQLTEELVRHKDTDIAVLPPPVYLDLIAEHAPILLVANLLRNDPIALVVSRPVFEERKMSERAPLADRLRGLKGLRIGVAPHPPARLRALFGSVGMDADHDVTMVILHGADQNAAFGTHEVDALYAHTPFLETAIVDQDAQMLVDQPAGDVPSLASRQIHALVVSKRLAEQSPDTVERLVRAIARAEGLIHGSQARTAGVLERSFPKVDPKHIETIVKIYAPAVPVTPQVSAEAIPPALALFPAGRKPPSLDGIDLHQYVAPDFAARISAAPRSPTERKIFAGIVFAAVVGGLFWLRRKKKPVATPEPAAEATSPEP